MNVTDWCFVVEVLKNARVIMKWLFVCTRRQQEQ